MPRKKKTSRQSADINSSNKHLTKKWTRGDIDDYLDALGSRKKKVVEIVEHEKSTKYFIELERGGKIPVLCPKCLKGHISLVEFTCTNETNPKDVLLMSFLRCDNLKDNCDFVSNEKISKLTNKLLEKERIRGEKISQAHEERREHIAALEEEVEKNSLSNIFKAVFKKNPISVGISTGFFALCLILSTAFTFNIWTRDGAHEIKAGSKNMSLEYKYAAPEQDPNSPVSQTCQQYIEENKFNICTRLNEKQKEFFLNHL